MNCESSSAITVQINVENGSEDISLKSAFDRFFEVSDPRDIEQ